MNKIAFNTGINIVNILKKLTQPPTLTEWPTPI